MAKYNLENYTSADGLGFPLNFRRGNPNPLDNSSVWASLEAAKTYAATDATAYVGQILSVVDNANGLVDVYKITNEAGDLVLVGTVTEGDDVTIVKNDDDTLSIVGFESAAPGAQPRKTAEGELEWIVPDTTTVDGLSSAVTGLRTDVNSVTDAVTAIKDSETIDSFADVESAIETAVSNSAVTVTESTSSDYAKVYTLTQNGEDIGTINIPKDMVVSTGTVVTLTEADTDGHAAGTYLKLVLANATNDEIWIPVDSLIEYAIGGSTLEVSVSVDPVTHVITATLNDGSIAKVKLTSDVQASLDLADTAVQKITVLGTELTDGSELTVDAAKTALGLGTAAYQNIEAFDAAGAADDAKEAAIETVVGTSDDEATADTIHGAKAHATDLNTAMDERVADLEEAIGTGGSVDARITEALNNLDVADTAVANEYINAVTQLDGKISVSRAALPDYSNTYDAKGAADDAKEAAIETVVGTSDDTATADTIHGAKAHATDLNTAMDERVKDLETAIGEGGSVAAQIATEIGKLDSSDTAVDNQYVSSVSQEDGKVTITRAALPDYSNTYDAKGAAEAAQNAVIGTADDAADANTINGAKAHANAVAATKVTEALTWEEF